MADTPKYDRRHGGPFDRGSADAYYGRPFKPHYYTGRTRQSGVVMAIHMTLEERAAYRAGYEEVIEQGNEKDWT